MPVKVEMQVIREIPEIPVLMDLLDLAESEEMVAEVEMLVFQE